jgi:hypothetical protein
MDSNTIYDICDGNLDQLKKIPKKNITEDFSKELTSMMEERLQQVNNTLNSTILNSEIKYVAQYCFEKKQNIEKCILYLKKIK